MFLANDPFPALRKHISCLRLENHKLIDTEQAFLHFKVILGRGERNSAALGLPNLISNAWCRAPRNPRVRLLPPTVQAQNPMAHNCLWLVHKTLPLVSSRQEICLWSNGPLPLHLWLVRVNGSCFVINRAEGAEAPSPPLAQE